MDRVFVESTLENMKTVREEAIRMAELILRYRKPYWFYVVEVSVNHNHVSVEVDYIGNHLEPTNIMYPTKYFYMLDCEIIEEEKLNQIKRNK